MACHDVLVEPDGTVKFIHDTTLASVFAGEAKRTVRVSEVEPASLYGIAGDGWVADMRKSGGPIITAKCGNGFPTREEALDAERKWLRDEWGL